MQSSVNNAFVLNLKIAIALFWDALRRKVDWHDTNVAQAGGELQSAHCVARHFTAWLDAIACA